MKDPKIILFDGVCNLCNTSVNFIIDHDVNNIFKFASLQSEAGQKMLEKFGLSKTDFFSVVLIEGNNLYQKSSAVLRIVKEFGGAWKLFYGFMIVPPFIRDMFYGIIAGNRYKWFGKKNECRIPTPELKEKFL